jgi:hypothetical protein
MAEKVRCEICDRTFKDTEGLAMHNKAKHPELIPKDRKKLPVKKIRNWFIGLVVIGLLILGIYSLIGNISERTIVDESELTFDAPKSAIHWHPTLTITIDGQKTIIPADIGITSTVHFPIHTHKEDINIGVIHMENDRPVKKTVTLGYFFEVWNKKFSKDCIFEYCADKGTLKMYVNGGENFEFEKYFMQDKDEIKIVYESFKG